MDLSSSTCFSPKKADAKWQLKYQDFVGGSHVKSLSVACHTALRRLRPLAMLCMLGLLLDVNFSWSCSCTGGNRQASKNERSANDWSLTSVLAASAADNASRYSEGGAGGLSLQREPFAPVSSSSRRLAEAKVGQGSATIIVAGNSISTAAPRPRTGQIYSALAFGPCVTVEKMRNQIPIVTSNLLTILQISYIPIWVFGQQETLPETALSNFHFMWLLDHTKASSLPDENTAVRELDARYKKMRKRSQYMLIFGEYDVHAAADVLNLAKEFVQLAQGWIGCVSQFFTSLSEFNSHRHAFVFFYKRLLPRMLRILLLLYRVHQRLEKQIRRTWALRVEVVAMHRASLALIEELIPLVTTIDVMSSACLASTSAPFQQKFKQASIAMTGKLPQNITLSTRLALAPVQQESLRALIDKIGEFPVDALELFYCGFSVAFVDPRPVRDRLEGAQGFRHILVEHYEQMGFRRSKVEAVLSRAFPQCQSRGRQIFRHLFKRSEPQ